MTAKTQRAKSKSKSKLNTFLKRSRTNDSKLKKELSLFYKLGLFFILLASVAIFYFMIIVSTSPRSFPFVTQKIQSYLKENVGNDSNIGASQIKFTRYGTLKVGIDDLQLFYNIDENNKQEFHIPRLEGEISLWNLITFNFVPSTVRIINPRIVIDNKGQDLLLEDKNVITKNQQTNIFVHVLRAIRDDYSGVEDFEIINAEFDIKGKTIDRQILVKESRITIVEEKGKTNLHFVNRVNVDAQKPDVSFNATCTMQNVASLQCAVFLGKFNAASISTLHPKLAYLEEIDASFDVIASFLIDHNGMDDVLFDVKSKQGRFEFLSFFSKAMDFKNLSIKGEFHKNLGIFAISDLKVDFPNDNKDGDDYAHLSMSATFSHLQNQQERQSDFDITLKNVLNDDLDKFWPVTLAKGGIRQWVIEHFSGGVINDAYANFTLKMDDQQTRLRDIKSRLVFSGLGLKYSDKFPAISDIKAVANFTKNDMNIDIVDGKLLESRILDTKVSIDDFHASNVMLHINGQSTGNAADSLKHVDNNDKVFKKHVENYLNGESNNHFDIRLPLSKKMGLKDVAIEVNSKITNLKNDYVRGGVTIATKKGFGSREFNTQLDLTKARIAYDPLDIYKEMAQEAGLDVIISFARPNQIALKELLLWKRNTQAKNDDPAEMKAELVIDTKYGHVSSLSLENRHFGENDYLLTYKKNNVELSQELNIKGKAINLGPLIENKFSFTKPQLKAQQKTQEQARDKILHSSYKIAVKKLGLANDKFIDGFSFALYCDNNFCHRGFIIGNYDEDDYVSINTSKDPNNVVKVEGRLTNVGYLADAFNISDLLSAAKVDVKLTNELQNGSQRLSGDILVDGKITIYETPIVKKLERDNLFSAVRDKIFSSNKVVFDSMKMNLALQDNVLTINSLLANNYKIGITAKGKVNLNENSYDLKGMIIPGYTINNLFGIGKIPVIGNVVTGILTAGQEEGGIFGIRYEYIKNKDDLDPTFKTNKVSAFVPTTIRNLFDKL